MKKLPDYSNIVEFFEIWQSKDKTEACMLSPQLEDKYYKVLVKTIEGKSMICLANFKATYYDAKIVYNNILGF
jgi:hypothetical protein